MKLMNFTSGFRQAIVLVSGVYVPTTAMVLRKEYNVGWFKCFETIIFCFGVAIFDLVSDVEAILHIS